MDSCSTSDLPSGNPLPELLSKLRTFEFSNLNTDYANCVSSDLKSLAEKDKKLRELLPIFEAQKKSKSFMERFLKEKAEEARKEHESEDKESEDSEDEESEDSEDEGSEDDDTEDEKTKTSVFLPGVSLVLLENVLFDNKAALTKLEVRSFVLKLWLRRIQLTRKEDQEKYNSLQNFERAIYSAYEVIEQFKDLIYKQCYNDGELPQMLPYHEDRLENFYNKALEEKEKASFEMTDEDLDLFFSNSARICSLLGLQLDFLNRLEEMPPEDRDHLAIRDWIVTFLSYNYESVSFPDRESPNKVLDAIGFDSLSSAVETITARAGNTQQHIEACEMAKIFIKDEFKYNLLLSPLAGRFPLQSNSTNTWFQLPSIVDEEGKESNDDLSHINIINLVTKEWRASKSMLTDLVSEDEQNIVLFHGTDHQSATDILFRGIDLREGRSKRDFSCGKGFYLTNGFDDALNWAKCTTSKPAILVFQVNRQQYLDNARKLNLYENDERWREIVSSFRSRKRTAKTRKSLKEFQLIEGPVATVRRSESEELVIEPKPSSYQLCLISDDFADEFRQTLHSIMFLDMSY